ncbi:MAG: cytidine deaminase [Gemmataceae bacterium]
MSDDLIDAARCAREQAFAPYSHFLVGAALETADGRIVTGCNCESAQLRADNVRRAGGGVRRVSDGIRGAVRIAIVADTTQPTPPCGACRQWLWEFGGDLEVILANLDRETGRYQLSALLPHPFDARALGLSG